MTQWVKFESQSLLVKMEVRGNLTKKWKSRLENTLESFCFRVIHWTQWDHYYFNSSEGHCLKLNVQIVFLNECPVISPIKVSILMKSEEKVNLNIFLNILVSFLLGNISAVNCEVISLSKQLPVAAGFTSDLVRSLRASMDSYLSSKHPEQISNN